MISCGARLAPFDIPQLREIMSYDELELDKLGNEKSALFFLISDTDTTYNFLVALAFSQMFNLLCERADNTYGGRLPYHVRVLWDEAANTGQVPGLEKIVAVIRSREISLTLFYQAMSQCKALYKDHSETIMGNMDSIVFLGGREASTLKDISENWLGKATISMQTEGRSRGQSESYSQNMQRLGRELMTTSEITTMPGDKCILQLRGLPPFLSPKYDLKKHPNYKYTAEFDKKKNAFRLESLFRHRPLRLKPEDEYTVYEVDGSDTDEEADLLNFDDLDSDEFVELRAMMTRSAADVGGFFCTQNHQTNKMEERIWNFSIRQSTFLKFWSWLLALVWRYGASSTFWKVTGRTTLRQMLMCHKVAYKN